MEFITNNVNQFGKDLGSMNMDLVDVLWNQDIDMGVTRDLYDPLYLDKQMKQRELEEAKLAEFQKQIAQEEALSYTIDAETGERIPIGDNEIPVSPTFSSQISLSKDLEELSTLINVDDINMEKYLDSVNPTEHSLPNTTSLWSSLACEEPQPGCQVVPTGCFQNLQNDSYSPQVVDDCCTGDFKEAFDVADEMDFDMVVSQGSDVFYAYNEDSRSVEDYKPSIFNSSNEFSQNHYDQGPITPSSSQQFTPSSSEPSSDGYSFADSFKNNRSKRSICRDEMRCRELNIPFPVEMITDCPVDEFNAQLRKHQLNEEQLNLIKDIRRRGKNKVAAQNCRKKKLHELSGLEEEINELKRKREALVRDKAALQSNLSELELQINHTYMDVLNSMNDANGQSFDPGFFFP